MYFDKVVVGEAEAACEADHQLLRDVLDTVHERETRGLEAGKILVIEPFAHHILSELHLVTLFAICCPCRRPDLRHLLPARVVCGAEGHL